MKFWPISSSVVPALEWLGEDAFVALHSTYLLDPLGPRLGWVFFLSGWFPCGAEREEGEVARTAPQRGGTCVASPLMGIARQVEPIAKVISIWLSGSDSSVVSCSAGR